ncbi:MAG: type 4a pilus biogenesis protein PilO, partial [Candidatus Eisenbacteria bacterium]
GGDHAVLPARVYALITENSLTPSDAVERGGSGALGVILLEELGRIATRSGLQVSASEPGRVSQEPLATQVRARILLSGRYSELIAFFDELSRSQSLVLVERFVLTPGGENDDLLELWVSRLYLKQAGPQQ